MWNYALLPIGSVDNKIEPKRSNNHHFERTKKFDVCVSPSSSLMTWEKTTLGTFDTLSWFICRKHQKYVEEKKGQFGDDNQKKSGAFVIIEKSLKDSVLIYPTFFFFSLYDFFESYLLLTGLLLHGRYLVGSQFHNWDIINAFLLSRKGRVMNDITRVTWLLSYSLLQDDLEENFK